MLPDKFSEHEILYRAVLPESIFWKYDEKRNKRLSSAALRDRNGLSVDRGYYRLDNEVINDMQSRLDGEIISFTVKNCNKVNALVLYRPSSKNQYHSEVHGSDTQKIMTDSQRKRLAKLAKILN